MKKPKIKKRRNYYLVYTDKKSAFKCYSLQAAQLWYNVLVNENKSRTDCAGIYFCYIVLNAFKIDFNARYCSGVL